MGRSDYYRHGDNNAICDRCGLKYKASELKREWNGLWTCPFDWEPRHPQDLIKSKHDDQRPSLSRPGAEDIFIPAVPFANAGIDQNVIVLDLVQLDGSLSQDTDGLLLTYLWTQISGPTVTLSSNTVSQPTFVAPNFFTSETLQFSLVVNNGGKSSQPNTVNIAVNLVPGAWDVANMVAAGTFDVSVLSESAYHCVVEADGKYLFWAVFQSNLLHRVTLLDPWNVLSIDMGTLQTYTVTLNTIGIGFNLDGSIMITTDDTNRFIEHAMTSPYDLNATTPTGKVASTGIVGVNATGGLHLHRSGSRAYVGKFLSGAGNIYSYTLSNFDINTIALEVANILPVLYANQRVYQPYVREDGARAYMALNANTNFDNIDLSPDYDLTSAVLGNNFGFPGTSSYGIYWKPDGSRIYRLGTTSLITQYDVTL